MADFDLTVKEIEGINRLSNAEPGVVYPCEDGNIYIGTTKGNLLLLQTAGTIPITPIIGLTSTNVQEAIQELYNKILAII